MIQPLHNYVLVKFDKVEEQVLPGGLVIPDLAQKMIATGTIEAIGPDVPSDSGLKVGAQVLFPPYGVGRVYEPVRGAGISMFFLDTDLLAVIGE